jgi:hypothetical protein
MLNHRSRYVSVYSQSNSSSVPKHSGKGKAYLDISMALRIVRTESDVKKEKVVDREWFEK